MDNIFGTKDNFIKPFDIASEPKKEKKYNLTISGDDYNRLKNRVDEAERIIARYEDVISDQKELIDTLKGELEKTLSSRYNRNVKLGVDPYMTATQVNVDLDNMSQREFERAMQKVKYGDLSEGSHTVGSLYDM